MGQQLDEDGAGALRSARVFADLRLFSSNRKSKVREGQGRWRIPCESHAAPRVLRCLELCLTMLSVGVRGLEAAAGFRPWQVWPFHRMSKAVLLPLRLCAP